MINKIITCDKCGLKEVLDDNLATDAQGWIYWFGYDLCPSCQQYADLIAKENEARITKWLEEK